ncbi:MAG: transcription antitermination factor NusB [Epsilonproteobacteria bacterium]|nr:MAG: transcription antitermination factor NusB [Campylobacterota bacterium]
MATRHQARTAVIGLLYAYDLGNENIATFSDEIFEESKIRNKQRTFSNELFQGTIENLEMLDKEITEHLTDWDYKSIGKVEKAIMRLGAYEILVVKTDRAIIINEAVELAKTLADEKAPKFINGVLDAIGREKKVQTPEPTKSEEPVETPKESEIEEENSESKK